MIGSNLNAECRLSGICSLGDIMLCARPLKSPSRFTLPAYLENSVKGAVRLCTDLITDIIQCDDGLRACCTANLQEVRAANGMVGETTSDWIMAIALLLQV
jgi:hypothetical protein